MTTRRWLAQLLANVNGGQMHPSQRVPTGLSGAPLSAMDQLLPGQQNM